MKMDSNMKTMPDHIFERLGGGQIAYIRPVASDDVRDLFPHAPAMAPGLDLWALLNADGTPIVLTDSHAAALANALENDLETVSVH
jgi:hypothetical protein